MGWRQASVEGHAWPLAFARIVVFAEIASRVPRGLQQARRFARMPDELAWPPVGWRWVEGNPFDPATVTIVGVLLFFSAAAAAIGWRHRWTGGATVLLALYFMAVPQWFGKVSHNHHVLWLAALLVLARSADTLAVGRWRDTPVPSTSYGLPAALGSLLVASTYVWPAVAKLATPGWISASTIPQLQASQAVVGQPPLLVVTGGTLVLAAGAVAFQASGLVAVWFDRSRWVWGAAGLTFHVASLPLLGIPGWTWLLGYPLLLGRRRRVISSAVPSGTGPLIVLTVAALVVSPVLGYSGWPFATYPAFNWADDEAHYYEVEAEDETRTMFEFLDWAGASRARAVAGVITEDPDASTERFAALLGYEGVQPPATLWMVRVAVPSGDVLDRVALVVVR